MSDFSDAFFEFLDTGRELPVLQVALELGRYHHYRGQHGMGNDREMLEALKKRGYLSGSELEGQDLSKYQPAEKMTLTLIGSVMECLKDGREFHHGMLCGLTACGMKENQ